MAASVLDHRQHLGIAIHHEDVAADGIKGDAIGIVLRLDMLAGLERLEVEGDSLAGLAIVGIALAGGGHDADAVAAARHALHSAQHAATLAVQYGQPVAMGDVKVVRGAVINQIVPLVGGAERHGLGHMIGGRLGKRCDSGAEQEGGGKNGQAHMVCLF
jgi:hypothetical protein